MPPPLLPHHSKPTFSFCSKTFPQRGTIMAPFLWHVTAGRVWGGKAGSQLHSCCASCSRCAASCCTCAASHSKM
jgi:hypothetical protein